MANYQQPDGHAASGDDVPRIPEPVVFSGMHGGIPMGDSPNYIPMKHPANPETFNSYACQEVANPLDESEEITHNVDKPTATDKIAPSGE